MKKLLFILTLSIFSLGALSEAFAAPQNARQTKRVVTKKATKATARKATAAQKRASTQARTKAQERKEARNQEFGLMPSELDSSNHNVFHADASAIRGARDTESALRYLPFVTIINTAGFGQQFDLRGQGRLSANGVKLYINGIAANPVDSYQNPMPIATIIPSLIDEVSVTPGGGAVLYGSGAKGGTINVITSRRKAPYFLVGGGYLNTTGGQNSFNAFAQAAENISPHIKMNAGLAFQQLSGPRTDDSYTQGQAVVGAWYDVGWGQAISVDIDAFYGKIKTSPYGALVNESVIDDIMTRYPTVRESVWEDPTNTRRNQWTPFETGRYTCLSGASSNIAGVPMCAYNLYDFEPTKDNRADKGNGDIETTTIRATGKLGWESLLTQMLKINVDGFASLYQQKYDTYQMNLPYFVLGFVNPDNLQERGYNWFLPRPHSNAAGDLSLIAPIWNQTSSQDGVGNLSDGQRADWHFFDQSGSSFKESKFGVNAKMDYKHNNGQLFVGLSSHYEMSNKKQKTHLRQAIVDGRLYGGILNIDGTPGGYAVKAAYFRNLVVDIEDKTDINVMTNSIYVLERYDFSKAFSVALGARYEMKNYDLKVTDKFEGKKLQFRGISGDADTRVDLGNYGYGKITDKDGNAWEGNIAEREFSDDYKENYDNFTFELAPVYRYSNTGSVYARGEIGYIAPPAWAMLQRIGMVYGAVRQQDIYIYPNAATLMNYDDPSVLDFGFGWLPTNLESETYYTAELGFKELIGTRQIPLILTNLTFNALLFSANVFYTDSKNEFYFIGDTWSGMELGTYDKTRRIGVEVAMEQYLFDGMLGFNESLTYLKAKKFQDDEWNVIPYTYDYKATLGVNVNVSTFVELVDVSVGIWLQNSIYGNQNIYSTQIHANTKDGQAASMTNPLVFEVEDIPNTKLKPYIISDFGVSVGFNKNMGVVTVGVKNVFDTFYYDYYNNDRSAAVNENRFVIGRGRTVFLEGAFRY